jgi:hypothetical protein
VDLDRRVGHAQAGQLGGQGPAGGGRVGRGADDQDLGAGRGLADLVLDDPAVAAELAPNTCGWTTWPPG